MGIQGLLPLLKSTNTPVHIKEYSGKVAAVDTYSWLHKGAITCSKELCQGLPTTKFVDYCMQKVNLLRQHGVKPLLIFDGGLLPMKEEQEIKRARSRKVNFERALEHEQSGNSSAAYDCYQKAVDITPQIAFQLVKVLQEEHIPYIVAPYEADAQLAFLSIQGHVDVVITEDSDAIPFGCLKVLFKMDKFGQGVEFQYDDLAKNRDLNFTSFTKQMVLEMCILSGCDYLPSLQGMGVKRAHGLMRRFRSYGKAIKHLKYNGVSVPSTYEDMFTRAVLTFRHQWVYDPVLEDLVHLTPLPSDLTQSLDFLGPSLSRELGQAIARGEVDPISGVPFESIINLSNPKTTGSVGQRKRQMDLPIQKNMLTNYFLSASSEAKRQFRAPRNNDLDRISHEVENDFQSFSSTSPSTEILDKRNASALHYRTSDFSIFTESLDKRNAPALHCRTSDFSFSIEEEDQVFKVSASSETKHQFRAPRKDDIDRISPEVENNFQSSSSTSPSMEISDKRNTSALHCRTSDFSFAIEEEDQVLNFLNSKMACASSPVSVDLDIRESASYGLLNTSVTKKNRFQKTQGKAIVRSCYFSKNKVAEKPPVSLDTEPSTSDGLSLGQRCSDLQSPDLSTNGNPGHDHSEKPPNSHCRTEGVVNVSGLRVKHGGKSIDHITFGEKKHIPIFSSKLLGENIRPGKFASDTSHVEQYACIAQKSMERFVSTIAPFRCLAPGARASGLRRPVKPGLSGKANRLSSKASRSVEDLRQFAFTRSNCRSSLSQEESVPGVKSIARLNDYYLSEWD